MKARGFTLIEVLVAMGVLSAAALGGVSLLVFATRAIHVARIQGVSALAASARMDELRSLPFAFDADGQRVTDLSTNLAASSPGPGGTGLTAGGATLETSVSGFVDYLDGSGAWVGAGPAPAPGAVFVRRWAVEAPDGPDLLVLQVLVSPVNREAEDIRHTPGGTRLVTVRARVRR
jgi:prepilin-type N-terminal cleavage/methylation domain-containing protein